MKRTLLIVDDIRGNRSILKKILSDQYDTLEAADGQEALALLRSGGKDISAVLLDLSMPVMDGYAVLAEMRSDEALSQVPVIVTTGSTDAGAEIKALSLGANDFITKPYSTDIIRHRIGNTIRLRETAALANAAEWDDLTGLYSRRAFFERAAALIAAQPPGSFVMSCFDVDNFKVVNDQYGTAMGDAVLRHIADIFSAGFAPVGGLCCRIAADDFAVLYPRSFMDSEELAAIRRAAAHPQGLLTPLSFSIGRYIVEDTTLSVSAMCDRAALAEAAAKGHYEANIVQYDESMRARLLREQGIVNEMRAALSQGRFLPYFQPQYNHATGALIGAEALVRWQREDGSLMPPDSFVPVFERNGFIYEMDKAVWKQACALLRKWRDAGETPLPISVNVSRYDVFREDFFEVITGLVQEYAIPVELLRLEITESAFAEATEQIVRMVERLIAYGFVVEIDDFGSGYSSLNTLKDVPAAILKLDMRFLEGSGNSQRGGSILESVVRMAKWLGMSVIAEGVETRAQADYLRSIGCFYVQGYLYGRPLPTAEYEALARRSNKESAMAKLETVEHLDNNAFWDPASMDTLIFNSYVGGACIFEYCEGKQELLRINEKYVEEFGPGATSETLLSCDIMDYMDADDRERLLASIRRAIDEGGEASCEIAVRGMPGMEKRLWLRSTARLIARAGAHCLLYATVSNITERRERDEQLRFLNDMAHSLLAEADTDAGIKQALQKLMHYFRGARAYIFEFDRDRAIAANTYELCAPGVQSAKDTLQNVPFAMMDFWFKAFESNKYYAIEDIDKLSESRAAERELLRAQSIRSLFVVPLYRKGEIFGMMGVDDPTRRLERAGNLLSVGDYIAVMLTRRDYDAQLLRDAQTLEQMMQDMPGGYVKMRITRSGIRPVFMNDEFCRLCGMTHTTAMAMYAEDAYAGVHPEDIRRVAAILEEAIAKRSTVSLRMRLKNGKGRYTSVYAFYRITNDADGLCLNGYYSDATEAQRAEEQRRTLLDNLPCGACLYSVDATGIHGVYLNKRYRSFFAREIGEAADAPMLEKVHPEDVPLLQRALHSAIETGQEGRCDVRIQDGKGGYIRFNMTGNVLSQEAGTSLLCVAYTRVTEEELTYRTMFPTLLAAMMDATTDMAFAKDTELRYICVSSAFAQMAGLAARNDAVGKTDHDIFPKELADKYRRDDEALLASGVPFVDMVEAIPSKDAVPHYASTSKYPLRDAHGSVMGLYGMGRDITEYRESDSRLRLLTESIPGGLATLELSAQRVRALYYNEGFYKNLGYTREEYEALTQEDAFAPVLPEDKAGLLASLHGAPRRVGAGANYVYRCRTKAGGVRWLDLRGVIADLREHSVLANVVLFDITEQKEAEEKLRVSEEENRLAILHGGNAVCRYNVADRSLVTEAEIAARFGRPERIEDVPYGPVKQGSIAPESEKSYIDFFEGILQGRRNGSAIFRNKTASGWRWLEGRYSTIFAQDVPVSAVVSFQDVTERLEKEAIYQKWRQSLDEKNAGSYVLYRCSLSKENADIRLAGGELAHAEMGPDFKNFKERTAAYAAKYVHPEDRAAYVAAMDPDKLLADYYRGKRTTSMEYRELFPDAPRWLRITVELVEIPATQEVEAFLTYEDIDAPKRAQMQTLTQAQSDPLTGALNRTAFLARMESVLQQAAPEAEHALLMLDVDGFKHINDEFGHIAGDDTLVALSRAVRGALRRDDLFCRLGGDEFLIFLRDIPGVPWVAAKAQSLCDACHIPLNDALRVSASIGVAMCPEDGRGFEALYQRADMALYRVKNAGKDGFAFYADIRDPEKAPADR